MAIHIARNEDVIPKYDEAGFSRVEVLAGTYDGGIRNYKCFLKAGSKVSPEVYGDRLVL